MNTSNTLFALLVAGLFSGCGGGGDDTPSPAPTGVFSLGVSDAPVDADGVTIAFKQVVLKNDSGSRSFNVATNGGLKQVDLLAVQGSEFELLVSGQGIPVGEYQMCLYMQNSETANEDSSFVEVDGASYGLVTNSNGSCGGVGAEDADTGRLFFNKVFTIAAGVNNFVAEFNLARGLMGPHGNKDYWTLKPTSVQLVNTAEVGAIHGIVSEELIADCVGTDSHAVYLYPAATALADMIDFRPDPTDVPIAAARVNLQDPEDEGSPHEYEFGFVVAGTYSLGYSCTADLDFPEVEADEGFGIHLDAQDVIVTNGTTTERNLDLPLP
jgi:hypothetical protein